MKAFPKKKLTRILTAIGLIAFGYTLAQFEPPAVFGTDSYSVYARFDSVAGINTGHPVKMMGLEVGRVSGFTMDQDNQIALAKLSINSDITIYDDAIASIKMEGIIGKNYVSIDPGGSGMLLQPGETIIETESLIDIATLIGKYAFEKPANNDNRQVHWALKKNIQMVFDD